MINMTVDFSGALNKIKNGYKVSEFLDSEMNNLASMLETDVKNNTPVVTDNLQSSIIGKRTGFMQADVSTNVSYARYVEYGTSRFSPRAMFRKGIEVFKPRAQQYLISKIKALKL